MVPASVEEAREHFYASTMSADDYRELQLERASIEEDRMLARMAFEYDRYESQELAEIGVTAPSFADELAEAVFPEVSPKRHRRVNAALAKRKAARTV